jgi:hypothetical protein
VALAGQGADARQFSDRPGHSAASDRWEASWFRASRSPEAATARRSVSCRLFLPRPQIEDLGNHDRLLLNRLRGVQDLSRIPPPITKLIAPSSDKFNSRSIQRSPSSEPPRLRTFPSIEMLLPTRMKGSTPQRVDVAFLEGPQVASGLGTGLGANR